MHLDMAHPLNITRWRENYRSSAELRLGRKELESDFVDKLRVPGST